MCCAASAVSVKTSENTRVYRYVPYRRTVPGYSSNTGANRYTGILLHLYTLPLGHHCSGLVCPPWCLPTNCHYQGGVPGHHGLSHLDGLVVQGLPGEQKAWGSNPTLTRWSPTSVFNMGTLVASLPDAWLGRGCAKTGWPGVRLGEIAPLTCNLSVSVAVCTTVESAPSQRYTLLAAGSFSRQASNQPAVFIYLQCPLASTWGHTHLYCDAAHFSASSAIACNFLSSTSVFQ